MSENIEPATKFEPFRATEVWNEILDEFRRKVPMHRVKNADEMFFSGSAAVSTLETYLSENRRSLGLKEVTNEKVVKLCQILMNDRVFEPLISSADEKAVLRMKTFQATDFSLYRFRQLGREFDDCLPVPASPMPISSVDMQSLCVTPNSCRTTTRRGSSCSWKSFLKLPVSTPSIGFDQNNSCSRPRRPSAAANTRRNVNELVAWSDDDEELDSFDETMIYDLALFRLLTLIEIPVLDGILQFKSSRRDFFKSSSLETIFASLGISHANTAATPSAAPKSSKSVFDSELCAEIDRNADPWLLIGAACFSRFGSTFAWSELKEARSDDERRLLIFRKVLEAARKYCRDEPFFPAQYDEVLKEIFDLLVKKRFDSALDACQLLVLLLPNDKRQRLRCLMCFLSFCAENEETRVSSEMPNTEYVIGQFRDSFFKCHSLSKVQSSQLFDFMLGNCGQVLKSPKGFVEQVRTRQFRQMYTVAEPDPGISYCRRISPAQFEVQKLETSESALVQLVTEIVDDVHMKLSHKIEWMDKFKREYPELYSRKFSSLRW